MLTAKRTAPSLNRAMLRVPARRWLAAGLAPVLALALGLGIFALRERADRASEAHALFAEAQGQVAAINEQLQSGNLVPPKGAHPPAPAILAEGKPELEHLTSISSDQSAPAIAALQSLLGRRLASGPIQAQRFDRAQQLLDQAVAREGDRADVANRQADLGTAAALIMGSLGLVGLFWYFDHLRKRDMAAHLQALEWQALHDPLTGLGNRRKLESDFERLARQPGQVAGVMVLDLDRFKHFNDRFGHEAGDQLLVAVADDLARRLGLERLYRLGGDEFCVLADRELLNTADMAELCQALSAGSDVPSSWGVAELDPHQPSLSEGLRLADMEMYAQKRRNRGTPAPSTSARDGLVRPSLTNLA